MKINEYELEGSLTADNSGFSKWGFARKNGTPVFYQRVSVACISRIYRTSDERTGRAEKGGMQKI